MKAHRWLMALALVSTPVFAHEGHKETGAFDPPHGGGFAKMAGHYAEVYLEGGKLYFCFVEPDGKPAGVKYLPKSLVLKVTPKGGATTTLKAATAGEDGCASWAFKTAAKRLTVDITALVDGKAATAKITYEIPQGDGAGAVSSERYVCPMGDSAPSNKPGKCPTCGMDLVLEKK